MDHDAVYLRQKEYISGHQMLKSQNVPDQKTEIVRNTHKKSPQTYTQTGLTTRYENVPKPYRNTKNRSIRYVFKEHRKQCSVKKLIPIVTKTLHTIGVNLRKSC